MNNKNPIISVVIPCYNSGEFLPEALESLKAYPGSDSCEVIIVDDGSSDPKTLTLLEQLKHQGLLVIHQENRGPAGARNTGVKASSSAYILFLDSDNKVRPDYIRKGIQLLDNQPEIGVVYGKLAFFGSTATKRNISAAPFEMSRLLRGNYIDMCSVIRKKVWEDVGGLDESRKIFGLEDWDFWIRVGAYGWGFCYLDEVLFDYRIRNESMITEAKHPDKHREMLSYMYAKHAPLIANHYSALYDQQEYFKKDSARPFRSFLKYFYNAYIGKGK